MDIKYKYTIESTIFDPEIWTFLSVKCWVRLTLTTHISNIQLVKIQIKNVKKSNELKNQIFIQILFFCHRKNVRHWAISILRSSLFANILILKVLTDPTMKTRLISFESQPKKIVVLVEVVIGVVVVVVHVVVVVIPVVKSFSCHTQLLS